MQKTIGKKIFSTKNVVTIGLMAALYIALYAIKIPIAVESRVSVTFIPVAVAAYLMGIPAGILVGGIGDLLSCVLFPSGPYYPGFTVSAMMVGAIYGLFFKGNKEKMMRLRVIGATAVITVGVNMVLNTLWLADLYEKAYFAFLISRSIKNLIVFPFQIILTIILIESLERTGITKKFI